MCKCIHNMILYHYTIELSTFSLFYIHIDPRHHLHSTARRHSSKRNHPTTSYHKHSLNRPLPPPPPPPPHIYPSHTLPYPHTYIPPPTHPIMGPWDIYRSRPYYPILHSSYPPHNQPSPLKLPPGMSLEKSSLPCAWSYIAHYNNGIPPHSTSTFFRQLWGKFSAPVRNRSRVVPRKLSSPPRQFGDIKKSPSNISAAVSEPLPNRGLPVQLVIPPRDVSPQHKSSKKIKESPKKEKIVQEKSPELKSKMEKPLPYEVPVQKRDLAEETASEEAKGEKDEKTKSSKTKKDKKKTSPKRKKKGKTEGMVVWGTITSYLLHCISFLLFFLSQFKLNVCFLHSLFLSGLGASALTIASSSPPNVTVNAGGSTMLTCLSAAMEGVTYEWYKGKEKLPSKGNK